MEGCDRWLATHESDYSKPEDNSLDLHETRPKTGPIHWPFHGFEIPVAYPSDTALSKRKCITQRGTVARELDSAGDLGTETTPLRGSFIFDGRDVVVAPITRYLRVEVVWVALEDCFNRGVKSGQMNHSSLDSHFRIACNHSGRDLSVVLDQLFHAISSCQA